jgi:metallo-beta-lactamase class B
VKPAALLFAILCSSFAFAQAGSPAVSPGAPIACSDCDEWNRPQAPFRIFGNTYYVGVAGLSSILVTSDAGHVLLDGPLPQSAPLIEANIRALGFAIKDIRVILNSHAHFDHSGGIAALQRASGATVAASASGARALQQGYPTADDPQYTSGRRLAFAPVPNVRVVKDGEAVRVGGTAITAHMTPGHTPGSTTWTWQSCEGARCLTIVYADSLNAVSDEGFRFTADPARVEAFRRTMTTVETLPCDVLLTVHPGFARLSEKAAQHVKDPATNPFIDAGACRAYAADARKRLEARLAAESGR